MTDFKMTLRFVIGSCFSQTVFFKMFLPFDRATNKCFILTCRVMLSNWSNISETERFTIERSDVVTIAWNYYCRYPAPFRIRTIYSRGMRHVRSRRRGPRAISCVRVEKWKKNGGGKWPPSCAVRPTFLADPHPSRSESRFNSNKDHNDSEEGEMLRKFHGGSRGMSHEIIPAVARASRDLCSSISRHEYKRISLTSSLCVFSSWISFSFEQKKRRRCGREKWCFNERRATRSRRFLPSHVTS